MLEIKAMDNKKILPDDFLKSGVFTFSNNSDLEFKAKWNKIEYSFPPRSTTPLSPHLFPESSPIEIQHIRKKFAYEWAQREILETPKVKTMDAKNQVNQMVKAHNALTYVPGDLEPLVKMCLEPLPITSLKAEKIVVPQPELSENSRIIQNKTEQPNATGTDTLVPNGLAQI